MTLDAAILEECRARSLSAFAELGWKLVPPPGDVAELSVEAPPGLWLTPVFLSIWGWSSLLAVLLRYDTRGRADAELLRLSIPIVEALELRGVEGPPVHRKREIQRLARAARRACGKPLFVERLGADGVVRRPHNRDYSAALSELRRLSPYNSTRIYRVLGMLSSGSSLPDGNRSRLPLKGEFPFHEADWWPAPDRIIEACNVYLAFLDGRRRLDDLDELVAACRRVHERISSAPWYREDPLGGYDPRRTGVDLVRDIEKVFGLEILPERGLHRMKQR